MSERRPAVAGPIAQTTAEIEVNGASYRIESGQNRSLLAILREDLGLTGSRYGCGEGQCGACTVLVDGVPRKSCMTTLNGVVGRSIVTIEGLERDGQLHPLQEAFLEEEALQCGYCTSGMIVAGVGLLERNPNPSEAEIIRHMQDNICRCGTYRRIIAAITSAATKLTEDRT